MTMKTKILILSAIIVFCIQAKNNDISYEETCYRYIVPHGPINRPSGSYSCVWNYEITNNSNQNYVTWINRLDRAGSIGNCKFSEKFEELLFWR